jgi:hypothetical protein
MKIIEGIRFIECPETKKSHQLCDPDVAAVMHAKDQLVYNKKNWLIFDEKQVNFYS